MKKLIAAALVAAVAVPAVAMPAAANAQDRRDYRQDRRDDRRDYRQERREDRRDYRQERREDRRDYRTRQWGENDWRSYRNSDRRVFARGQWRAPFRYHRFRPGVRISAGYYGSRYVIADPWRYRLPPLRAGYLRYVRHYDDVLLIDVRRGTVIRVYSNFFW